MSTSIKLSELNDFISCPVCHGYLIDATTVNECLHTFCKSCIVKHIKNDNNECPKCNTVIHERRPLDYIVHDRNKQDIVYKLVPQLYISELNRKIAVQEMRGLDAITRLVLKKKFIHVALVQKNHKFSEIETVSMTSTNDDGDLSSSDNLSSNNDNNTNTETNANNNNNHLNNGTKSFNDKKVTNRHQQNAIYLKCPLTIRAFHIKKLLAVKYQLEANDRINLYYKGDAVSDSDQITNLAQSLTFCLHYEISRLCTTTNTFQQDQQQQQQQQQQQHEDNDEDEDDDDANGDKHEDTEDTELENNDSTEEEDNVLQPNDSHGSISDDKMSLDNEELN